MQQPVATPTPARPPVKKVSKGFFLWSYIGSFAGIFVLAIIMVIAIIPFAINAQNSDNVMTDVVMFVGTILILIILMIAVGIYCTVIQMILIYKAWQAIQDGHQRTTPGKAVGFQFIPLFNYYWIFQAIWGFSKDFNAYNERYGLGLKKLKEGLFLTNPILTLTTSFLGIGSMANAIIFGFLIHYICNAINGIAEKA
jgi:hypothetical protein